MSQTPQTFQAVNLSQQFKAACVQFDTLLASSSSDEITELRQRFRDSLQDYKQKGALTVAFVGQYSAGKSTIISALTGQRDIHIDADIATDTTTTYDWNGIKVIDTPGLFTDRADHDEITYDAIAKADLLVLCLTHMLFDTLTVENFKKLAYDKGYRWKIMLLVNKMSAAAGEEDQKIASYRHSLAEALKPNTLTEFPIAFIDAKDYCEGLDEDDDFLVEISRFDTFIAELNQFVTRRASLVGLDTPVRIVLDCLDEAQLAFARNSNEDTVYLEILSRLSRRIYQERERLHTKARSIKLEMSAAITTAGSELASAVGEPNFEDLNAESEIQIRDRYERAGQILETITEEAIQSIHRTVEAELQSDLTQAFVAQLRFDGRVEHKGLTGDFDKEQLQGQVKWLQDIGNQVGGKIADSATRGFVGTASDGFLRSMDVAGGDLHKGVLAAGKLVGFKFKPWQAVGIAKNIGNAAKFLGPALALVSLAADAYTMHKEREAEQKMSEVRSDITSQFKQIAIDLSQQIDNQLQEFETKVYGHLEQKIAEARNQTESAMANSHAETGEILVVRDKLKAVVKQIQQLSAARVF